MRSAAREDLQRRWDRSETEIAAAIVLWWETGTFRYNCVLT